MVTRVDYTKQSLLQAAGYFLGVHAFLTGNNATVTIDGETITIEACDPDKKINFIPPSDAASEIKRRKEEKVFEKMKEFISERCILKEQEMVKGSDLLNAFNTYAGLHMSATRAFPDLMNRVCEMDLYLPDGDVYNISKKSVRNSPHYMGIGLITRRSPQASPVASPIPSPIHSPAPITLAPPSPQVEEIPSTLTIPKIGRKKVVQAEQEE